MEEKILAGARKNIKEPNVKIEKGLEIHRQLKLLQIMYWKILIIEALT